MDDEAGYLVVPHTLDCVAGEGYSLDTQARVYNNQWLGSKQIITVSIPKEYLYTISVNTPPQS